MKIPNYVIELMKRSSYCYEGNVTKDSNYAAGYTININKRCPYQRITSLEKEITKLMNWVQRTFKKTYKGDSPICYLLSIPNTTHYRNQNAVITIFDPMMKHLESYITNKKN